MYAHQSISSVHRLGSKLFDRPSYAETSLELKIARLVDVIEDFMLYRCNIYLTFHCFDVDLVTRRCASQVPVSLGDPV